MHILFALLLTLCGQTSSIYNYSITTANGTTVPLSTFQGKKLLIVNIATGSARASQLAELQQLHQQKGDSLVIIAIPSNSFGNEARSNAQVKAFCETTYGTSFLIAQRETVTGSQALPLYQWLTQQAQNDVMNASVNGDFHKFLIDESGNLMGTFTAAVSPLSPSLLAALSN